MKHSTAIEDWEIVQYSRKRLFTITLTITGGLLMAGLALLAGQPVWGALSIAARVILHLLPLPVWIGGTAVSLCWLLVLGYVWRD